MSLKEKLYDAINSKDHITYDKIKKEYDHAIAIKNSTENLLQILWDEACECYQEYLKNILKHIHWEKEWQIIYEKFESHRKLIIWKTL